MIYGYVDCACRDCFEIAIGRYGKALCHECQEAGCKAGVEQECQSPTAYGVGDLELDGEKFDEADQ